MVFRSPSTNIQELMKSKQFYRFSSKTWNNWLFTNEGQLILNFNLSRQKFYLAHAFFFFPTKKIILLWCQCNNMRFSALNYVTIVCHSRSHDPKPPQSREGSGDDSKILRTLPKCVTQTPVYSEMDTGTTGYERTFPQKATKIVY